MLASTHFNLALIDLKRAHTDGLALATEIRKKRGPNTSAMLILMIASANPVTVPVWPLNGFRQKPIAGKRPDSSVRSVSRS